MGLEDKVIAALQPALNAEYIQLDADDGISGFVVSKQFERMSTLDRQKLIDDALNAASDPLTREEQRQVLMIAGLTPAEYEVAGARVRVHQIRECNDGSLEVFLRGGYSDAGYVRGALNNRKGVQTTEPMPAPGAIGGFMTFSATGTALNPLTKATAIRLLEADPYIQVMDNA